MVQLRTDRLLLRPLTPADAPALVALLNEPSFLRFIGDRGVRTEADALRYLDEGPLASYAAYGFGLYAVERRADGAWLGLCGLLRRPALADPDLGFAFLPAFWGQGYAREAAGAWLRYGQHTLALPRIVAIVAPENDASIRLLTHLGFAYERDIVLEADGAPVKLFAAAAPR